MKMNAAVLRQFNRPVDIEEVELAPPKEKEVLVRTAYTGFCRSDLHFMDGDFEFPLPLVLGHEASGVVVEIGPGVTTLQEGDHVVAAWMVPCGECHECSSGQNHICSTSHELHSAGTLLDMTSRLKDSQGRTLNHQTLVSGFGEFMVIPEKGAIKIREDLALEQACFLGCCMPTGFGAVYNAAGVKPGDSVAIWGIGGVGLNVVHGAHLRSAYPIIAIDLEGINEPMARTFGATHFINNSKEDPVPIIKELTGGGANFCFEAIGDPGAVNQAMWSLALGGKLVQIGITPEKDMSKIPQAYTPVHCKKIEGTLYGNIEPHRDIPAFADMAMRGDLLLDKLITKFFKVGEINDVAEAMRQRQITGRWVCKWD